MADKNSLEQQVKALQRQMGGIAKLVKELKTTVENMQKENEVSENDEIQEIIDAQQLLDEIIVANSDAIKRIEKEIKEIAVNKSSKAAPEVIIEADDNVKKGNKRRKCRYYNRGYCKHTIKCRYLHPENICKVYSETQSCKEKSHFLNVRLLILWRCFYLWFKYVSLWYQNIILLIQEFFEIIFVAYIIIYGSKSQRANFFQLFCLLFSSQLI